MFQHWCPKDSHERKSSQGTSLLVSQANYFSLFDFVVILLDMLKPLLFEGMERWFWISVDFPNCVE